MPTRPEDAPLTAQLSDGAVLVRVRSRDDEGLRAPDAVFAFRAGDPQFLYWNEKLRAMEFDAG